MFKKISLKTEHKYISADTMALENLDKDLIKIFFPLFSEIISTNAQLDKESFVQSWSRLYSRLSPLERNIILQYKSHLCDNMVPEERSFSPEISQRSREIASILKVDKEDVVDKLLRKHNERRDKLTRARQEKADQEMEECTFQPNSLLAKYSDKEQPNVLLNRHE